MAISLLSFPCKRESIDSCLRRNDMSNMEGAYIYGIVEKGNGKFNPPGEKLYTIDHLDLAALVKDGSIRTFDRFNKDLLMEELKEHQLIVEKIMTNYDILPMSFGIIAKDERTVKNMLKKGYGTFKKTFVEIKGKNEINIKAFWDEKEILKEIGGKIHPHIPPGGSLPLRGRNEEGELEEKIALGKQIASLLEKEKKTYQREIHNSLKEVSLDFSSGKITNTGMILNESFLVEKREEFDERVERLNEKYGGKINFKYIGPMFPYSFFNLKVTIINPEKLRKAREILNFKEEVPFSEIKERYRQLALQTHPDRGDSLKDEKFKNFTSAYKLLSDYYKSYPSGNEEGEVIIVKENERFIKEV